MSHLFEFIICILTLRQSVNSDVAIRKQNNSRQATWPTKRDSLKSHQVPVLSRFQFFILKETFQNLSFLLQKETLQRSVFYSKKAFQHSILYSKRNTCNIQFSTPNQNIQKFQRVSAIYQTKKLAGEYRSVPYFKVALGTAYHSELENM